MNFYFQSIQKDNLRHGAGDVFEANTMFLSIHTYTLIIMEFNSLKSTNFPRYVRRNAWKVPSRQADTYANKCVGVQVKHDRERSDGIRLLDNPLMLLTH